MTDRPILFSGPMVRALRDGSKTQTRRVLKPQPPVNAGVYFHGLLSEWRWWHAAQLGDNMDGDAIKVPYAIGDRLYVKEAWKTAPEFDHLPPRDVPTGAPILYLADGPERTPGSWGRYRHGRFMCRWMTRVFCPVTNVRVQRVQEISEADAVAEGAIPVSKPGDLRHSGWSHGVGWGAHAFDSFRLLWDQIHGPGAWERNEWIAAYSLNVQAGNIDEVQND